MDDDEDLDQDVVPPPAIEDRDGDDLHAIAADYEKRAKGYRQAMDLEAPGQSEPGGKESAGEDSDVVTEPESENEDGKNLNSVREVRVAHKTADANNPVDGLSFVWMSTKKLVAFAVDSKTLYVPSKNTSGQNEVKTVHRKNPMKRKHYPEVTPTPAQRQPFARADLQVMNIIPFQGPSPALAEGERVVALAGKHSSTNGYILHLREIWDKTLGKRVPWARVVPPGPDGAYKVQTQPGGKDIRVGQLRRSILDLPYTFKRNDRVRVVSGDLCKGACGRVVDIDGPFLTIAIPPDVAVLGASTSASGLQTITIPMKLVRRDWLLGDSVRVRWGGHIGRRGVIVRMAWGLLTIFDVRSLHFFFGLED